MSSLCRLSLYFGHHYITCTEAHIHMRPPFIYTDVKCLGSQTRFPFVQHQLLIIFRCLRISCGDSRVSAYTYSSSTECLYWSVWKCYLCWPCCHGDWWAAAVFCSGLSLIAECGPETTASSVFPPLQLWPLLLSDYITAPCSHFITVSLMQDNVSNCLTEQFITWRQPLHHAGFREAYRGLTVPYFI